MSTNYGVVYKTARDRLMDLLSDLQWHSRKELELHTGNRYSARLLELKRLGYVVEDAESETGHGKDYRLTSLTPSIPQSKKVKVFLEEEDAKALINGILNPSARVAIQDALGSFETNKNKL